MDEASGLNQALEQIPWWKANHVYPIYFVWRTGFWQTIIHLLQGIQQRPVAVGARDFFVARRILRSKAWLAC